MFRIMIVIIQKFLRSIINKKIILLITLFKSSLQVYAKLILLNYALYKIVCAEKNKIHDVCYMPLFCHVHHTLPFAKS